MTGNQLKDILDGINVSLLRLNDRIDKLEAAKEHASNGKIALDDDDYTLSEGAGWFDVGPFTVRMFLMEGHLRVQVHDQKIALECGGLDMSMMYDFQVRAEELSP